MPIWTVQLAGGQEERLEADLLATEGGALVGMSEEGLLVRAWAPGHWQSARHVSGVEAHPAGKGRSEDAVVVGLPGR